MYRFKTKEEFINDGEWDFKYDVPIGWNTQGKMNHLLGKSIPNKYNEHCDLRERLAYHDDRENYTWNIGPDDYVEYFVLPPKNIVEPIPVVDKLFEKEVSKITLPNDDFVVRVTPQPEVKIKI